MAQSTEIVTRWFDQRIAVAALIGHCESIAASGRLTEPSEQSLRLLIAETISVFGMIHNRNEEMA